MAKRILIDARMYGLENAGIGRYLINLIEGLSQLGKKEQFIVLLRKKYFNELELPPNWKKVEADFRHYTFEEQFKLPEIIDKEEPDLVHFPHLNVPILWRGKFVLTVHDLIMQKQGTDATSLPLALYFFKRIPFLLIARSAVKRAMKIVVPSEFVKKDVENYYSISSKKVTVSYEGVTALGGISNSPHFAKASRGKQSYKLIEKYDISKPYFLYVGNAYPHKNLKKTVEAIVLLNSQSKEKVMFTIAGSRGVFKKRLAEEIKRLGAEKYVKLLGYIPDEDLFSLYKNAIAFVYPSKEEGFGLQGLEAMAAGTLVLASDIPVFREIYGHNAFYFDPNIAGNISELMLKVKGMTQKDRNRKISESQRFIKRYSWQKMAKETLEVYKQVLEKK
ncbi:hypothetical protein A2962_05090 [Candidatus Woesebacteria bacterium RIFCSPLOWO2_01_FULL_39_61]|uniref:Glycosyl transferase family 1 domain-containing protein n=1 Tax=Candidatus Woesebacteria bacterium RIFCSPHIGHO2_02_FULL_39_13 TaxID=1802505 RepID=A0A1F7YZ53_9BACT|nr:MAG: hypothetical protein A2692_03340 [Candidatus Woesebacteria bacterium RIFCSPHIGHO2_01_FULL_39_95]OGM32643.1 MAG: hypothetical protein A3D01_05315 [Candidatus Woesebacteria bacterium RIFCSPHIGHO2_02_FULL_39_13]OGM66711.1 MAG: hypothetical protein A2962_05090 [Candidatus Woesebacteria bacterium RIFCSPLOWO2_01_FULL_39_61]OGM73782.1 MAG: hypothetical protein A3H19_02610 [Candidatus Woesebacteria bacterium RIFCSPLOWO2_12_FULL_39_9]